MPKALSGEMLADPFVPIDRPEHHSFNRRVKAAAPNPRASSATLRSILARAAAILKIAQLLLTHASIRHMSLDFITES